MVVRVCLIQLESVDSVMPSATYIDAQIQTKTGQAAIDQYICDNTGRTVEMIPEVVAEISQFVEHGDGAQINEVETSTQKIYGAPVTDAGLQGRLFRGTKRLLGDERVRRLMVFDQPFRLVALITPLLLRIQQKLNSHTGLAVDYAHIGHPVNFEGRGKHRNPLALDRLSEAYKHAGCDATGVLCRTHCGGHKLSAFTCSKRGGVVAHRGFWRRHIGSVCPAQAGLGV